MSLASRHFEPVRVAELPPHPATVRLEAEAGLAAESRFEVPAQQELIREPDRFVDGAAYVYEGVEERTRQALDDIVGSMSRADAIQSSSTTSVASEPTSES